MIFGHYSDETGHAVGADLNYTLLSKVEIDRPVIVHSMDILAVSGATGARMRGVIYRVGATLAENTLVATTEIEAVDGSMTEQQVRLSFDENGIELPPGEYLIGPNTRADHVLVYYGKTSGELSVSMVKNGQDFEEGPPPVADVAADLPLQPAIFLSAFEPYEIPELTEEEYGRLPFPSAQAELSRTSPDPSIFEAPVVGWHDEEFDQETGSFVIARSGSDFEQYVGERIKLEYDGRTVVAYCHRLAAIEEDLSLTREAFSRLEVLTADDIDCSMEVLS